MYTWTYSTTIKKLWTPKGLSVVNLQTLLYHYNDPSWRTRGGWLQQHMQTQALFVLLWQWHWQRWWMVRVHTRILKCRIVLFRPLVSRHRRSCGGYTHCMNKSKLSNTQKVHERRSFVIRTARLTVTQVGFESGRILSEDAAEDQKEVHVEYQVLSFLRSPVNVCGDVFLHDPWCWSQFSTSYKAAWLLASLLSSHFCTTKRIISLD